MEVRVISTEIIKPSSPTPPHLRTHKLSLLDQLNTDDYFPLVYFYSGASKNTTEISDHLKSSLAKALTQYYPFAGRVIDNFSVECDDSGATFIEARVANEMSEMLKQPEFDQLVQLLPFKDNVLKLYTDGILVVVQVNYFSCGGVVIGVYFNHVVADAAAAATFIQSWAAIASGGNYSTDAIYNCTTIFPPQDLKLQVKDLWGRIYKSFCDSHGEAVAKRFIFHDAEITALRERIRNGSLDCPTRFEAVSALILGAMTVASRDREGFKTTNVAYIPVSLQNRMNPPLPKQHIGSICLAIMAKWSTEKIIDYNNLAGKLHESIATMDEDYMMKLNEDASHFLNGVASLEEEIKKLNFMFVSSTCRFPFYDADFGWGKPKWASVLMKDNNTAILSDTGNGEGIEVWVGLSEDDMAKFEKNPDILAYASINPSIE
ncbi:hypothetical protein QYF36_009209 [Acer negundo]|nr:hypothetical protein QYF36_009209 [Acer negundo]